MEGILTYFMGFFFGSNIGDFEMLHDEIKSSPILRNCFFGGAIGVSAVPGPVVAGDAGSIGRGDETGDVRGPRREAVMGGASGPGACRDFLILIEELVSI
jgi:hypothetical protein